MKQKTMYVDSCPRGGSDPEAVSGSSTRYLDFSWKKSPAKEPSLKNESGVNPDSFF
ncbi:hypothetical protein IKE19_00415 [Candidatus Saccharibacteria bacterium]|nr:hypothetical protein [Candidatus Saccharibacteria bacterium]